MKKKKTLCFDLDGVICKTKKKNYFKAKPIKKNIGKINELFNRGYKIIIFTARFMGRSNENKNLAKKKGYSKTLKQLARWKIRFHKLYFGKPSYDLFVDDRNLYFKKSWTKDIEKQL